MSNSIEPIRTQSTQASTWAAPSLDRRTARGLVNLERRTMMALANTRATEAVRIANVESESVVASVKVEELAHLGRTMVTEYTMLRRYSDIAAAGDVILADELRFMTDTIRLGMGEVAADLVSNFRRESRQ